MDDKDNVLLQASGTSGPAKSRAAVISFVLANVALGGLFLAQLVPELIVFYLAFTGAIVYGHLGKRDIGRDPENVTGFAMAQYGLMVGYFCLLLAALALFAMTRGV
jgi:hypothetical protein